jgi:response regulator RpfG family c-di-GMP phosphodiesterase
MISKSQQILFAKERDEPKQPQSAWRLLIVDDEPDVHAVTELALEDLVFAGLGIEFGHAYTAREARDYLKKHPDTALVLLDVVMESDQAGLELVDVIRNEYKNALIRIILRTGQPGQAPEREVILRYDINDYREKTDLTSIKLFSSVVSALRNYRDLMVIEKNKIGLEKIIRSSGSLYNISSLETFISGVLTQLEALLNLGGHTFYSHAFGIMKDDSGRSIEQQRIIAGTGNYASSVNQSLNDVVDEQVMERLKKALTKSGSFFYSDACIIELSNAEGHDGLLYIEGMLPQLDDVDYNLVEVFVSNAAIALGNLFLTQEIEFTQKEVLYTLGEFAECRSREISRHVARVSKLTGLMGEKLGFDKEDCEMLQLAAAMHDIGKIAIPNELLEKPGPLSDNEWQIMHDHCRYGHSLLNRAKRPLLKLAAIIAHQHHEWWDGTGYPQGLKGEQIHLYGRIVAVADVFDALGNVRVYKDAWSLEQIVDYFKQHRGRQFDPELTDLLLENIEEFAKLREIYSDESYQRPQLTASGDGLDA